jgi:hypothetical protein
LTQNKLLKKCKTAIFLFIVFTLASSVVSTAAFVLTGLGNMNNNIVFAKKSKDSGGSSKDNGGSSSDKSSPTESSNNDQGPPPESDNNQPSSTGSDAEKQQPPAADQTACPDRSQPDTNGNCPTTQSTSPPVEGTVQEQQQPPTQQEEQQCPIGQHFDNNQNVCISDTTASEQNTPAVQQENKGIVGPIGGLPPSALETKNNPPLIPECSAGFKPDGKGGCIQDCGQESHYESKIHRCQPNNITCTGETHYDTFAKKCESNDKGMPPFGECVEGYHLDKLKEGNAEKCYNNASPTSYNGNCAPGWHLLPGVSYKICVADSPPVTKTDVIEKGNNPSFGCPADTHEGSTPGQCIDNTEQLPNGQCAEGWHHQTINDVPIGKCTRDIPQVECPQGYHPSYIESKIVCVKDETMPSTQQQQPTQTDGGGGAGTGGTTPTGQGGGTGTQQQQQQPQTKNTPIKCGKGTHPDPKLGQCVVNDVPLPDGTCAPGWHLGKSSPPVCLEDTLSPPNQQKCKEDQHLDGGKCVDNNVPLSNGKCVPGYHLDTKAAITKQVGFCIKDEPSKAPTTEPSTVPPINGACMEPTYHLGDDNLCHKDVITTTPPSQTPTSGSGQQQQQGLVGPAGGLPPSALETGPGPASIGLCKSGSQMDPKIDNACKPDYITCSGDTHYNRVSDKCVSDSEELPVTGKCVPGYHLDSKLDPTGHTCYKDLPPPPPVTKASDIRVSRICSPGLSHYDPNTGKCVLDDNSDKNVQRVNGNCANIPNEPTHYDPDLGTCAAGPPPPCSPGFSHYDPNTGKCKPDSDTKQCGVLSVPAHFDPDTGYCVPDSPPNPPSSTQTGGSSGTSSTPSSQPSQPPGPQTPPPPKQTGGIVVKPLPDGKCPTGYHLVAGVVCIKDIT